MNKQEIEKAIEALRDFNRCVKAKADGVYETTDFINAKETAISALEQQLTMQERIDKAHDAGYYAGMEYARMKDTQQLNNGWIPVSERLPEYTDDYNVTVGVGSELGYFEEVRTYRYEIYNGKNPHKKWIIPNNFHEIANVIAWQPLPEPYKELATDNNVVTKSGKDNNALTIGDKIRESNESLAEFIKTITDKCIIGSCHTCPIYKACDQKENKEDLVKYFSQPYTK